MSLLRSRSLCQGQSLNLKVTFLAHNLLRSLLASQKLSESIPSQLSKASPDKAQCSVSVNTLGTNHGERIDSQRQFQIFNEIYTQAKSGSINILRFHSLYKDCLLYPFYLTDKAKVTAGRKQILYILAM